MPNFNMDNREGTSLSTVYESEPFRQGSWKELCHSEKKQADNTNERGFDAQACFALVDGGAVVE
jgi:hypothetical protein